jgi:hypothetical protein
MTTKKKFKASTPTSLVAECMSLDYFHPNEDGKVPIPLCFTEGQGKLILGLGGNASGKSFFRRVVQSVCKHADVECIHLSMEGRGTSGITRSFIYGTEEYRSTGQNSAQTVLTAISTSLGRENKHVLFFDEPDIGLSDGWAASVGETLLKFSQNSTDQLVAAFIITHSKPLVRQLIPSNPHYLSFRSCPFTPIKQWVNIPPEIRTLEELQKMSMERFKLIQGIMNKNGIKR